MDFLKATISTIILTNLVLSSSFAKPRAHKTPQTNTATPVTAAEPATAPSSIANLNSAPVSANGSAEYQKIIEEANDYFASLPEALRQEIEAYRIEMAKLNSQKADNYKKLSQAAKDVLKKDREYRKILPLNLRKDIGKTPNKPAADATTQTTTTK